MNYNPYNQLPIYNVMPSAAPQQKYYQSPAYLSAPNPFPMSVAYVTGIEGANAFNMTPGSSIFLLDNENQLFFLKECDMQGRANITPFKLVKIDKEEMKPVNKNDYITRTEFEEYIKKMQSPTETISIKEESK